MKIIKKGKTVEPKKKKCHSCKTEFEYTKQDIKSDRDGTYVVCPNEICGKFIHVTPSLY